MTETRVSAHRSRNRKRLSAIAAAGIVLAAGVTVPSLAAWTDTEWVIGGLGNGSGGGSGGVSTSTFEVEQRASGDTGFAHHETEGVANIIDFTAAAQNLSLGDTVYAWVDLRTVADSLGGELALVGESDMAANELTASLRYRAAVVAGSAACNAAGITASTEVLKAAAAPLDAAGDTTFSLLADSGDTKTVCFELTLPLSASNDIQGQTAQPLWSFAATSVTP